MRALPANGRGCWAAELAGRGIRVNALTPGPVATPGDDGLRAAFPQGDQATAATPLGRAGRPDEVAATALYPAGDQSSFTTGAERFVDGGATRLWTGTVSPPPVCRMHGLGCTRPAGGRLSPVRA